MGQVSPSLIPYLFAPGLRAGTDCQSSSPGCLPLRVSQEVIVSKIVELGLLYCMKIFEFSIKFHFG